MQGAKRPGSLRPLLSAGSAGIAGAILASMGAAPALAQNLVVAARAPEVEGVTVTRTRPNLPDYVDPQAPYKVDHSALAKLTQPLLDTPKSVSVITEDLYDDLGATNFRDIMRTQPGVTLGTGEGGNAYGDRIFIRGFEARNDIYIDGVRDPGVGAREIFDVDQIEILKGPSSTVAGRGTTGGAVNIVSKLPLMRRFGDLEATYADDGTRRVTLDVNQPVSDQLQVRFNGMYTEAGVAGRNAVFNDRWGWAGSVAWRPLASLKLGFDYYHVSTDEMPDFGVPYDLPHNRPFKVDRNNFYGVVARDYRKTYADIYTARADWEVTDNFQITSAVRYGQSLNSYTASAPESPDAVARTVRSNPKRRDAVTGYWAAQTNARLDVDTGPLKHTFSLGVEGSNETIQNRGRAFIECATLPCTGAATALLQNLDHPNPFIGRGVVDTGITSRTTTTVDSVAFYALDTVKLGEHWEAMAGLRHDSYDIKLKQLTLASGALVRRGQDTGFWNVQAGLTYKPVKNASLYAAFATSSNPSGEQIDSLSVDYGGLDPRVVGLKPERNKSYEVGAKWNVADEHLMLTAALFRVNKTNARVTIDANTVLLAGEQRSQGFELGASGAINPRWQLSAGLTYIDAEITDSPTVAQIGARFPNVPRWSWSATTKYKLTKMLTVGTTVTHSGRRYGGQVAATTTSIPGYTRLDLFGSVQITRRFAIDFNFLNVTDKVYYDALYRSATPFTYIAPGRSMLIKADYHF